MWNAAIQDGKAIERVFDVAHSDDPRTHRCPDNKARFNLENCSISRDVGAGELKTIWVSPGVATSQH